MWTTLLVGDAPFVGDPVTRSVVTIDGDALLELGIGRDDGLYASLTLYDEFGRELARLTRNRWAEVQEHFEYAVAPRRVVVRHRDPRRTVLDVSLRPDEQTLAVVFAELHTPVGRRLLIDREAGIVVIDPRTMRRVALTDRTTAHGSSASVALLSSPRTGGPPEPA